MKWGLLALTCASACSFTFVQEPTEAMLTNKAPLRCTVSRGAPVADLAIGAVLGGLVFATTYIAIDHANQDLEPAQRYRPWGPALIGSFLVVSPWGISSAVGFSETGDCRKAIARANAASVRSTAER